MTDLTDRMRTCAAAMLAEDFTQNRIYENERQDRIMRDAADLLIKASNALDDAKPPLGEPMEVIKPQPPTAITTQFHDPGPGTLPHEPSPKACPKCDSRATKTTRIKGGQVMLICPVCATEWEWKPQARWT